jgi:hypothetical protein
MPCRMIVEGEVATLRVTLVDRGNAPTALEFSEIFEREALDRNPEELRKDLEEELTDEARRLLASDDVSVTLSWKRGSLEVAALIACGKVVADVGAFLTGVREIRDLFPQRIRDRISAWLGRDVAMRDSALEMERGLLRGKAEDDSGTAAAGGEAYSPVELAMYAGLSLVVLIVIAGLVILGVTAFL